LHADQIPDGWQNWLNWLELCAELGYRSDPLEAERVWIDAGRNLGFPRIAAQKRKVQAVTLEPPIGYHLPVPSSVVAPDETRCTRAGQDDAAV